MDRSTAEKHLLASNRDYWSTFEARVEGYVDWERQAAGKALLDCADLLSRKFGHSPSGYLFGDKAFTPAALTELFGKLRQLRDHAYAHDFHQGVTALYAMKAIASLMLVKNVTEKQSVRDNADRSLDQYRMSMQTLIDEHRLERV